MNLLILPELFHLISTNLNDKDKIFFTSCSKFTYKYKSLIKLDLEYDLEDIYDKEYVFNAKNISIKKFVTNKLFVEKINSLIKNHNPESITIYSTYMKWVSNGINIKLFFIEFFKILIRTIAKVSEHMAVKIMLKNDESIENINNRFVKSSKNNYLQMVKLLIKKGANIHWEQDKALIQASRNGHLQMVKLLIELGANIHASNNWAMIYAIKYNHIEIVSLLISKGSNINSNHCKPLIVAIEYNNIKIVRLLLSCGVNIKKCEYAVSHAIHYKGNLSIVKLLVENGANIQYMSGRTISFAVRKRCYFIVKFLI